MSKFTPGPWAWYWKESLEGEAECGIFSQKRPGMAYSVARCPKYQNREQWEANARLIAAAPEMYKLLSDLIEPDVQADENVWPWQQDARALLDRIDGEDDDQR